LEKTLEVRMKNLPNPDFEDLLHSIFKADEWKLVLLGGVLGLALGYLEYLLFDS